MAEVTAPIAVTVRLSVAVLEGGTSLVVTVPVVLMYGPPGVKLVTSTVTVQLPLAGMVAPLKLTLGPPSTAVTVPPAQVVAPLLGVALMISIGYVSLTAPPVNMNG